MRSAGRPAHDSPSEKMVVKMINRLPGPRVRVQDHAIPFRGNASLARQFRSYEENLAHKFPIVPREVEPRRDVLPRDNQNVNRRLRGDVLESHQPVVLVDDSGRYLLLDDLAEETGHDLRNMTTPPSRRAEE